MALNRPAQPIALAHARRAAELAPDNPEFRQLVRYLENRETLDEFSRVWPPYRKSPESRESFGRTVEKINAVPERGISVWGPLEAGFPPTGMGVVEVKDETPRDIEIAGPIITSRPPTIGVFLPGLTPADVPLGARIRAIGGADRTAIIA